MKRKKAYIDDRRNEILKILNKDKKISVEELAKIFNTSPITIRRDLQFLEDNNKLIRFYGGAKVNENPNLNHNDDVKIYRTLIAKYAATLISNNDTVFINSSSTSLKLLEFIENKNITVITNNTKVINLDLKNNINIILSGGEIRHPKEIMVGDYAIKTLQNIYAKKAFIGCSGISLESGMTTENFNEVNINKIMIEHSVSETYFLADHTKICKNSSFISCPSHQIKNLITDEKVPEKTLNLFRKNGIKVHVVKNNQNIS